MTCRRRSASILTPSAFNSYGHLPVWRIINSGCPFVRLRGVFAGTDVISYRTDTS